MDVEEVLDDLRAISESKHEQGVRFERLMCAFFRTDTAYYNQALFLSLNMNKVFDLSV